jgi:hypothetical protein
VFSGTVSTCRAGARRIYLNYFIVGYNCAYEEGVVEGDGNVGADDDAEVARDDAREARLAA